MAKFKRNLITTALPYANGPVHIGHLAGVYVPADIYVRYLRQKGEEVVFIGGSDEHGVPITIKAQKEGVTPQDIVDRYHQIIKDSFEEFGISFDIYSRTSSKTHHELSSAFFKKLYDEGKFIEKTSMQFYDEKAGQFLADRYIVGKCPHCGNERAYGDQCEACGTSLNATDLIDPVSAVTGNKPELKETKHWYLPLDRYEDWLKEWILEGHKEWKSNVYGQCKSWLDNGLQPRAVTRDLDWGVPVPLDEAKGKVLYVWFDAPIGYISATKDLTPEWEKYWKDPETRMIHFIGKDNIVFHCIIFRKPCLLCIVHFAQDRRIYRCPRQSIFWGFSPINPIHHLIFPLFFGFILDMGQRKWLLICFSRLLRQPIANIQQFPLACSYPFICQCFFFPLLR